MIGWLKNLWGQQKNWTMRFLGGGGVGSASMPRRIDDD